MPKISVLMPAFNSEKFIEKAVLSTLNALPPDSELVVGNDGSTDSTLSILYEVRDKRLRIVENKSNLGLTATLNHLIEKTSSKFIARMDSDDICMPHRFFIQDQAIEDSDVVFSRQRYVNIVGKNISIEKGPGLRKESLPLNLLLGNCLAHPTMFAKRTVIENVEGYSNCVAEDYELWLRLISTGAKFRKLWEPTVKQRLHSDQITSNANWDDNALDSRLLESYSVAYEQILSTTFRYSEQAPNNVKIPFAAQDQVGLEEFRISFDSSIRKLSFWDKSWLSLRLSKQRKLQKTIIQQNR